MEENSLRSWTIALAVACGIVQHAVLYFLPACWLNFHFYFHFHFLLISLLKHLLRLQTVWLNTFHCVSTFMLFSSIGPVSA